VRPRKTWKTKQERREWWRSLTHDEQQAKIAFWQEAKDKLARSLPPTIEQRTKLPFTATIKPLDGPEYQVEVSKTDDGIVLTRF
jgi:hypothetical protein